jgi:hypothetical protein
MFVLLLIEQLYILIEFPTWSYKGVYILSKAETGKSSNYRHAQDF